MVGPRNACPTLPITLCPFNILSASISARPTACWLMRRSTRRRPEVEVLPIPQLVAAGTVESRIDAAFVPLSRAGAGSRPAGRSTCLGQRAASFAVGEFARQARSRKCPTGPWARPSRGSATAASIAVSRSCPGTRRPTCRRFRRSTASQRYLEHLIAAWKRRIPTRRSPSSIVVLTVPASFDASARELTREAALAAGLSGRLHPARRAAGGGLCLAGHDRRALAAAAARSAIRCWSATSAAARPT